MANDDIRLTPQQLAAFALTILATFGYTTLSTRPETIRPDPFTGQMGRDMESRLNARMDAMDRQINGIQAYGSEAVRTQLRDFERRLKACEEASNADHGG